MVSFLLIWEAAFLTLLGAAAGEDWGEALAGGEEAGVRAAEVVLLYWVWLVWFLSCFLDGSKEEENGTLKRL